MNKKDKKKRVIQIAKELDQAWHSTSTDFWPDMLMHNLHNALEAIKGKEEEEDELVMDCEEAEKEEP